jgi:hypothetical protein
MSNINPISPYSYQSIEEEDLEKGINNQIEMQQTVYLASEIWLSIFSYLPPSSLVHSISLTCKNWHHILTSPFLWHRYLPLDFVPLEENRDYRSVYLNWLAMAKRAEKKDWTEQEISCPFGGFFTSLVCKYDLLFLGSSEGIVSVIDTQKTDLLCCLKILDNHAIQAIDVLENQLVIATVEKSFLMTEEDWVNLQNGPISCKGTLQFWRRDELTAPVHSISFDHAIRSIKLHCFFQQDLPYFVTAVHTADQKLHLFDEKGKGLKTLNDVISFSFCGFALLVLHSKPAGNNQFSFYKMQFESDNSFSLDILKKRKIKDVCNFWFSNIDQEPHLIFSLKTKCLQLKVKDFLLTSSSPSDYEIKDLGQILEQVSVSGDYNVVLAKANQWKLFSSYALAFFKNGQLKSKVFLEQNDSKPIKICLADKRLFILGISRLSPEIVLSCYDFEKRDHLSTLASQVNWIWGQSSFASYLLKEKKWFSLGFPVLMGAAFSFGSGIALLKELEGINEGTYKQFLEYGVAGMSGLSLFWCVIFLSLYRKDLPNSLRLFYMTMTLPLFPLLKRNQWIKFQLFEKTISHYLNWKMQKTLAQCKKDKEKAQELKAYRASFEHV